MTLWLYSWVLRLMQPLMRRKLMRRAAAEPGYGVAVEERFGHYAGMPLRAVEQVVWVHAVSLGETRAAAALIDELRAAFPGMRLLFTHGTATGMAQGKLLLKSGDLQTWQPWDTPGAVGRFLDHFKPRVGLLVETEVWPNMVAACKRAAIPLCLVNARLSDKSLHQAQRLAWLALPAYQGLRAVWAQAPADAKRLEALGAPVRGVMGNFKYDASPDPGQLLQGRAWRQALGRPVLMLAVSREGEELQLLDILRRKGAAARAELAQAAIKSRASDPQWMIVPRHPQRFDEIAQLCVQEGFSVSRRSQWRGAPEPADIWLGDSLGEMALYYGLSDVALLGGSFAPLGGHNLIEAAACGCPVLLGPHTFNFAQAAQLAVQSGAALQVPDMDAAVAQALALSSGALREMREAASVMTASHQGAARRTAQAVRALLVL